MEFWFKLTLPWVVGRRRRRRQQNYVRFHLNLFVLKFFIDFFTVLHDETLKRIASKNGCTLAQVAFSWELSKGIAIATKTENEKRMRENLAAADVTLSDEDIADIDKLGSVNQRLFWSPYDIA